MSSLHLSNIVQLIFHQLIQKEMILCIIKKKNQQ